MTIDSVPMCAESYPMSTRSKAVSANEEGESTLESQLGHFIFVGGSPRSGTTLVQRILNSHPEIYGGPEFDFVPPIAELFRNMRSAIRGGRIDSILQEDVLANAFRGLVAALLTPKLRSQGVSYLSEKTPSNVLAFAWLQEYVPESKNILVLRDPRDVVRSMLEVGRREKQRTGKASGFVRDTVAAVDYMNECLKAGAAAAESGSNCFIIYYEDLIADPLATANAMYRFIGVPEKDQLDLEKFEAARDRESWVDWDSPGTMSGGVETGRVGLAEQQLSRSDWDYICAKTLRHPLVTNRYALASPKWTLAARWCAARCMMSRFASRLGEVRGMLRSLRGKLAA
jgi:hypothetical protein